jgi:predicted dehydrogenase
MIRIGIVGSDSFHAQAFSSIVNHRDSSGQYLYPDFKVTAIYGEKESRTEEIAKTYQIPVIVKEVHEMLGKVDAVMILLRDGSLHLTFAIPFLKAGIPVWMDKPFTASKEDCYQLLCTAKSYQTLITGPP